MKILVVLTAILHFHMQPICVHDTAFAAYARWMHLVTPRALQQVVKPSVCPWILYLTVRVWKLRVINTFQCHSPCCRGSEEDLYGSKCISMIF